MFGKALQKEAKQDFHQKVENMKQKFTQREILCEYNARLRVLRCKKSRRPGNKNKGWQTKWRPQFDHHQATLMCTRTITP